MCTVTIIPQGNKNFVLTSNRDESPNRVSLSPDVYTINNTRMLFPKDELSGGTWVGVSDKNRLVCVLNGGFLFHERKASYRMSRGLVANDFLNADNIDAIVKTYDFQDIEPFTMVIADWNEKLRFFELVWDGHQSYFKELPLEPKIWSSSTLYSQVMKQVRQDWFEIFKSEHELNANSMLNFHKNAGKDNDDYGVVMDRGFVKTTSITQVKKCNDSLEMHYMNLNTDETTIKGFIPIQHVNE